MKLLLSGFEPFGGSQVNPAAEVVQRLVAQPVEGVELVSVLLPVERFAGPDTLIRTYISTQPDMVLCLGEAGGSPVMRVERVAINLLDFLISDNGGHLVTDKPVAPDGPDAYFTTLPVRPMVQALSAKGVPAQISYSAGTFLCNAVIYDLLHYIHRHQLSSPAGFIHLPQLPQQVAGAIPPRPSMSLETMVCGMTAVIQTLAASIAP